MNKKKAQIHGTKPSSPINWDLSSLVRYTYTNPSYEQCFQYLLENKIPEFIYWEDACVQGVPKSWFKKITHHFELHYNKSSFFNFKKR